MSAYKTVLMTNIDNEDVQIEFDVLNSKGIDTNSQVTTHPLVNGDIVADHMYRQPVSLSLAGSFSLAGTNRTIFTGSNDRLTNIEETFEKIKNKALLCKLVTVNEDDNKQTRFKIRENMVLNRIHWTELQNSLDFTLGFDEAMLIDAFDTPYDEDVTDDSLPALTDPRQLDFTDTLIDWDSLEQVIIKTCKDAGIMSKEFCEKCLPNIGKMVAVGAVGAALIGVATVVAVACGASGPIGWIAGAIIAGAACIVYAWYKIINSFINFAKQQKFKVKQFKYYKDDRKNAAEVERFLNFNGEILKQIEQLEDSIFLYGFSSDENQECTFYLDNQYYIFKFERKTNGYYEYEMRNVENKILISNRELIGLTNISECNSSNAIYRTPEIGSYIYIMNPSLYEDSSKRLTEDEREANKKDLTKYMIMVTTIKMENFMNMTTEIIKNAVMY